MVVRMRHTRSQTNSRRSHHALTKPAIQKIGASASLRHRMDPTTGAYRGRQVVDMGAQALRKAKRSKEKESAR